MIKVEKSNQKINPFGGINFVIDAINNAKIALDNAKLNVEILADEVSLQPGQSNILLSQQQEQLNIDTKSELAMLQI